VPENYLEAVAQFHRAAEQGVAFSHFFLGMIFAAGGNGVEADPVQAYKWLTLAAALHTAPRYREDALSSRKPVADGMSASQIAVAEQLALNWMNDFRRRTER
jgi:TPR repeat protein